MPTLQSKGKKGHFPEETHIVLPDQVHNMLPEPQRQVVFLRDGEFDGVQLQRTFNNWGWLQLSRTGTNIKIFLQDKQFNLDIIGQFLMPGSYRHVEDVLFTNKKYGPVMVIVWWAEHNEEPIYLVTNMRSPTDACDYYSKRFRIETFFSDQKSRGFNIDKSKMV